jgi:hypothetical protein
MMQILGIAAFSDGPQLNPEEAEMIRLFRTVDKIDRMAIRLLIGQSAGASICCSSQKRLSGKSATCRAWWTLSFFSLTIFS